VLICVWILAHCYAWKKLNMLRREVAERFAHEQ
jgi:hypothetical protein